MLLLEVNSMTILFGKQQRELSFFCRLAKIVVLHKRLYKLFICRAKNESSVTIGIVSGKYFNL